MALARLVVLTAVVVSLFAVSAGADTFTFVGASGAGWGEASNWDPSGPPGIGDTAIFDLSGSSWSATVSGSHSVASISLLNSGNPLALGGTGSLIVSTGITGGAVALGSGTLTLAGSGNSFTSAVAAGANLNVTGNSGAGQITLLSGGRLSGTGVVNGAVTLGNGLPHADGNPIISGTLTVNGQVSFSANNNAYTLVPGGEGSVGVLTLNNGTWSDNTIYRIDCGPSGTNDQVIFGNTGFLYVRGVFEISAMPGFAGTVGASSFLACRTPNAGMGMFAQSIGARPTNPYLTYGIAGAPGGMYVTVTRAASIPDFSWTGGGTNANWDQPGNWNHAGIAPIAGDTAAFDLAANLAVTINGARAAAAVNLANTGTLTLVGTGTLTLGNALTIAAGQTLKGTAAVAAPIALSGGRLAGPLSVTGNVTSTGGTIAPAPSSTTAGTLAITGNLVLDSNSVLNFNLGSPGTTGSGINDLITVSGDLTLDGTLNIAGLAGFQPGTYRLFNYAGTLTDSSLIIGTTPDPQFAYDLTSGDHQVDLVVSLADPWWVFEDDPIEAIYDHFGQSPPSLYDTNGDQVVDIRDVVDFVQDYYQSGNGDANLDRFTDFEDFQILLDHWQQPGRWAEADFTGDQFVNFEDFQKLLDYWNPTGWSEETSQVPEPATVSLLAMAGLALIRRGRKR